MASFNLRWFSVAVATSLLAPLAILVAPVMVRACPFCNAQTKTLSEELDSADAAVIAKMLKGPSKQDIAAGNIDAPSSFEIEQVLKGPADLPKQFDVLYFGQQPVGTQFLVSGAGDKKVEWAAPNALSPRAAKYVSQLLKLPKNGADRMVFFQEYLEDKESVLANDAYEEFARAPYAEVKDLKPRMHRDRLLKWIADREVPASRRRLYLTMLGVCGQPDDIAVLEEMIKSSDRQVRTALDAMVACYLILKGPEGMPLIEELFLTNKDAEYTDTYAAIMALRFLGQETKAVPKERLLGGLRAMLDRPNLADLVIPDLARWQDWSCMDKLVSLFKNADEESSWVKVPVVNYLRACPKPEAKAQLAELAKIDPESVKRASTFFPFGTGGAAPAPAASDKTAEPLVPAPDKPAKAVADANAKPSKATKTKGKGPQPKGLQPKGSQPKVSQPGQSTSNDTVPVVPELIGEVVAMADTAAANNQNAAQPPVAGEGGLAANGGHIAQRPELIVSKRTTAKLSGFPGAGSQNSPPQAPMANRWQVSSVALAAAAGIFTLIVTILRGN